MDVLTIDEYHGLSQTPKEIRGHYFSRYVRPEHCEPKSMEISLVIDGRPYDFSVFNGENGYKKMVDTMQPIFKRLN